MDLNSVNDNADSAGSADNAGNGTMGRSNWWGEAPERPSGLGGEIKLAATRRVAMGISAPSRAQRWTAARRAYRPSRNVARSKSNPPRNRNILREPRPTKESEGANGRNGDNAPDWEGARPRAPRRCSSPVKVCKSAISKGGRLRERSGSCRTRTRSLPRPNNRSDRLQP